MNDNYGSVIVRLAGGLGNQLFQYSAGLAISVMSQKDLLVDTTWYSHPPKKDTPRLFLLDKLGLQIDHVQKFKALCCYLHNAKYVNKLKLPFGGIYNCFESHHNNIGSLLDFIENKRNILLTGFWQDPSLFKFVEGLLRHRILSTSFGDVKLKKNLSLPPIPRDYYPAALHIRRGDYVSNLYASKHHGTCSTDYYYRAISVALEKTKNLFFYVFTDDPLWCSSHLTLPPHSIIVSSNITSDPLQDLLLMARCHYFILSNSTFGWWGSWLAGDSAKLVIAPRQWFNYSTNLNKLILPHWHTL